MSKEILSAMLNITVFHNALKDYVLSFVIFLGLVFIFTVLKNFLIRHLKKIADKTATDSDDFVVALFSQIGLPVVAAVSLYIALKTIFLPDAVRSFFHYALVIVLTISA
ncbi:MAG: hypothetical protein Q7J98_00535, partial [Kiritimatiellia bacterium]|nr:hypothetical protein [Kiritimatiellia bacterium]